MRISLIMIVQNEEANLPVCLKSAIDLVDELVVVDTGSNDSTKQIAAGFGAKVIDYPWSDSFSAARNESRRHASGDWLFVLDADDQIDAQNHRLLKELFAGLIKENAAYLMQTVLLGTGRIPKRVDHIRVFPNDSRHLSRYRVHEQIRPSLIETGCDIRRANILIDHLGYQDPATARRKAERNLRLLLMDYADQPDNPDILFSLGKSCLTQKRPAEGLNALKKCLEIAPPDGSIHAQLYLLLGQAHQQLGQRDKAMEVYRQGRQRYPLDAEILSSEAFLRCATGDFKGGETCLLEILQGKASAGADARLRSAAHYNLGLLYQQQNRHAEAEKQYRAVLVIDPGYTDARNNLAILMEGGKK